MAGTRKRRRQRTRRNARAYGHVHVLLPVEMWTLVLLDALALEWRFCVRFVCKTWKAIVDNAPMPDYATPWPSLASEFQARKAARGRLVRASCALVQRATLYPDVWLHSEGDRARLLRQCQSEAATLWGEESYSHIFGRCDIVVAVLRSNIPQLIDHAIENELPLFNATAQPGEEHCRRIAREAARYDDPALLDRVCLAMPDFVLEKHCKPKDAATVDSLLLLQRICRDRGSAALIHTKGKLWQEAGRTGAIKVIKYLFKQVAVGCKADPTYAKADSCHLIVAARAAAAHGHSDVIIEIWNRCSAITASGRGGGSLYDLLVYACRWGGVQGIFPLLVESGALYTDSDIFDAVVLAIKGLRLGFMSDPYIRKDGHRVVRSIHLLDAAFPRAFSTYQAVKRLMEKSREFSGVHWLNSHDSRLAVHLALTYAPLLAREAASGDAVHARSVMECLCTGLVDSLCTVFRVRKSARAAEYLVLTLDRVARVFAAHGITLAYNPWNVFRDTIKKGRMDWQSMWPCAALPGAMAYVLARIAGLPAHEALKRANAADTATRWYVSLDHEPLYEAPIASWRRWWRPHPMSLKAALSDLQSESKVEKRRGNGDQALRDVIAILRQNNLMAP